MAQAGDDFRRTQICGLSEGYSVRWTMNLILLGLAVGVFNVYVFIRKNW